MNHRGFFGERVRRSEKEGGGHHHALNKTSPGKGEVMEFIGLEPGIDNPASLVIR